FRRQGRYGGLADHRLVVHAAAHRVRRARAAGALRGAGGRDRPGLAAGDPMVLFAEGTTSDGNLLKPFNSTLFGAAKMARDQAPEGKVFIQPVAIAYTRLHGMPLGRDKR